MNRRAALKLGGNKYERTIVAIVIVVLLVAFMRTSEAPPPLGEVIVSSTQTTHHAPPAARTFGVYQVKDTRPLTEKTNLVPDDSLWRYPKAERALSSKDLKGPWWSQFKQDSILYTGFFRKRFNGTFVELGAADGTEFSNTRFYQDSMGWIGVLIEPSQDYEHLIAGTRAYFPHVGEFVGKRCLAEKKVHCVNAGVCQKPGNLTMLRSKTRGVVSGALDFMTEEHKKTFRLNDKNREKYQIPCKPFGQILRENGIERVDLLSLDVEGAEEVVLETMDWTIPVHVIVIESVEANSPTGPEGHERKHRILLENGFRYIMYHDYDEFWVNPQNAA